MKCDFDYCIYNENYEYYFDEVGINSLGMCEECIIFSLSEEKLQRYKKKQLHKLTKKYGKWEE